MQPNAASIDDLAVFPFVNNQAILDDLKAELPLYLAKAADTDSSFEALDWYRSVCQQCTGLVVDEHELCT